MRVSIMGGESVTNTGVNVGENQIKATATLGKALAFDFFFFLAMASPFELLLRGTKIHYQKLFSNMASKLFFNVKRV